MRQDKGCCVHNPEDSEEEDVRGLIFLVDLVDQEQGYWRPDLVEHVQEQGH